MDPLSVCSPARGNLLTAPLATWSQGKIRILFNSIMPHGAVRSASFDAGGTALQGGRSSTGLSAISERLGQPHGEQPRVQGEDVGRQPGVVRVGEGVDDGRA